MSEQGDLFDALLQPGEAAPAAVTRLPVTHWAPAIWRPRVRPVAKALEGKRTEAARNAHWAKTCHTVATRLGKLGATPAEIDEQLIQFFVAVDYEMHRLRGEIRRA